MSTRSEILDVLQKLGKGMYPWDDEALRKIIAAEMVWRVGGRNRMTGDWRGYDEWYNLCSIPGELTNRTADYQVHDVIASDDHGVLMMRVTAEREGRPKLEDSPLIYVCHVEGGQLKEVWECPGDQYTWDAFWS